MGSLPQSFEKRHSETFDDQLSIRKTGEKEKNTRFSTTSIRIFDASRRMFDIFSRLLY